MIIVDGQIYKHKVLHIYLEVVGLRGEAIALRVVKGGVSPHTWKLHCWKLKYMHTGELSYWELANLDDKCCKCGNKNPCTKYVSICYNCRNLGCQCPICVSPILQKLGRI